ncbi:MAG: hypothetical protein V3T59_00535 [Desulfobacterales bacterium]
MSPERSEVEFFNFSAASHRTLQMYPRLVRKFRRWSIGTHFLRTTTEYCLLCVLVADLLSLTYLLV